MKLSKKKSKCYSDESGVGIYFLRIPLCFMKRICLLDLAVDVKAGDK